MRSNRRDHEGGVRLENVARMGEVYGSLPTPPAGCNGNPLREWEASHDLPPLTGDDIHPRANILGLLGRLGGLNPSTGDPLPEGHPEFLTPRKREQLYHNLGVTSPPEGGFDEPPE